MNKILFLFGFCILLISSLVHAETGVAHIRGTTDTYKIDGEVLFQDTKDGLKISAHLKGVPPGPHGFHIHEYGSCDNLGNAAGSHYNPLGVHHGLVMKDGIKNAHIGDMGNIIADPDGNAELNVVIPKLSLTGGNYSVAGRAVILHEKADDFSQPVGNAGKRIGCGEILVTGK